MTLKEYFHAKTPYKQRALSTLLAILPALALWYVSPMLAVITFLVMFQVCRYLYLWRNPPVSSNAPHTIILGKFENPQQPGRRAS